MGSFRPSARVRLQIRVEEFSDTGDLDRRLERPIPPDEQITAGAQPASAGEATQDVAAQLQRTQQSLSELIARRESMDSETFARDRARLERQRDSLQQQQANAGRAPNAQQRPEALEGAPPDDRVILGNILPRSLSIERNGIRQADTCSIELDHADAPIDPRIVRACAVEVILGTVSPLLYQQGLQGVRADDGMLRSIVQRGHGSGILNAATRFVGWVDEWDVAASGDDGDSLMLNCRDMTALLIDTPLPTGFAINLDEPITVGIQALIDAIPATRGFTVRFGQPGAPPQPGPIPSQALQTVRRARRGRVARRARRGNQRMNLWDHITDTTIQLGLVPLVIGFDLHLIEPRTFYGRTGGARRMVYGRNLSHLEFSRKLGGVTVPTIQVRTYDGTIGRTRWAQHPVPAGQPASGIFGETDPPQPSRANRPGVSGSSPDNRIQTFTVSGVSDPEQLRRVAEATWQQIGRQELEGKFETDDISSVDVAEDDEGDLLDMNAGDAVELLVLAPRGEGQPQQDQTGATLQQLQAMSRSRRADYLVSVGWARDVAERLAALQDATGFQTVFRVQNVRISWDTEEGVSITTDFINFVTVRELAPDNDQAAQVAPPSPEVQETTGDRQSAAAQRLRDASEERRQLTDDRAAGRITQAEYDEGSEVALERELSARREFEGA